MGFRPALHNNPLFEIFLRQLYAIPVTGSEEGLFLIKFPDIKLSMIQKRYIGEKLMLGDLNYSN